MSPEAQKAVRPSEEKREETRAARFSAKELVALRHISQGKVHRTYLEDPLVTGLRQFRLLDVLGEFLCFTELGRAILADAARGE
jgi:hypothetical protein